MRPRKHQDALLYQPHPRGLACRHPGVSNMEVSRKGAFVVGQDIQERERERD